MIASPHCIHYGTAELEDRHIPLLAQTKRVEEADRRLHVELALACR